ncbi:hypothetical protein [Actinomadura sp. DC4]|uniref:hypothetical protein n=1 Tax=Actinomadura sp. DC4 TaxID=3055069 RepID=UPI0025B0A32A|nr:hypothetical protein [Actinomadura sp. DC4]MDN3357617.1 hypothetical protein [Actinomadura sp. DC4]
MSPDRFSALLSAELRDRNSDGDTQELLACSESTVVEGTREVLRQVLDHITEYEFENPDRTFFEACSDARARLMSRAESGRSPLIGALGLICLNVKLLDRRFKSPSKVEQREADLYCASLFTTPEVGLAIATIYAPDEETGNRIEHRTWDEIDFAHLSYHKAGTTSFILKGYKIEPDNEAGARSPLAIKCVLFPWNKITAMLLWTEAIRVGSTWICRRKMSSSTRRDTSASSTSASITSTVGRSASPNTTTRCTSRPR